MVSRWGSRGYGFVTSDDLETEAWLHVKFLDDPDYQPRQGDRVEFELERLPDGRYQARRVRLVSGTASAGGKPRPFAAREPLRAGYEGHANGTAQSAPLAVKLAFDPSLLAAVRSAREEREESVEPPSPRSAEPPREAPEPPVAILPPMLPIAPRAEREAVVPPPSQPLTERIAEARHGRRQALDALDVELQRIAEQVAALAARRAEIEAAQATRRPDDEGEAAMVASYLAEQAVRLEQGIEEHRRRSDAVESARKHAIQRSGLPPVEEYEGIRARLRDARRDELMAKAFSAFERERRAGLRDYADAMDRLEAAEEVAARFVAFTAGGRTVLVAPVRAASVAGARAAGELLVRVACAFWHTAERGARELGGADAVVEHGLVAGLLAVRCGTLDPGLLPLLLDETWSSRPSLERLGVEPEIEQVEGLVPPWEPEPEEDATDLAAAGGAPAGFALPEVSTRLGLSLHDLVAMLHDRGLPFPDDQIDAGTEETLRSLLGDASAPEPARDAEAAAREESAAGESAPVPGPIVTRTVAGRMLRKLLRDRRVGGRHTRIENAYGHHFSDEEKLVARRVAEWLEKEGIFMPKLNEGSHHISINPRRLRDVGQIIEGTWERDGELLALGRD